MSASVRSIVTSKSSSTRASSKSRVKRKKRSKAPENSSSIGISKTTNNHLKQKSLEVDFDHRTSLYCHIVKRDWEAASKRCQLVADEASTWIVTKGMKGDLRFLPLHKACVLQPPSTLLESLISAYPDGVWCEDHDGWLPLHCAAYTGANQDLIETLLLANPAGSRAKDQKGLLPLHYACMKGVGRGVIAPLLQYYPESIYCKDDNNRWPTHYAISKGHVDSLETVLSLSGPEALSLKDEDSDRTLLHYACVDAADDQIILMLLAYHPDALQEKDKDGNLPIHHVCQYKVDSLEIIYEMLDLYPESINIQNQMGHTPLQCAQLVLNHPDLSPTVDLLRKFEQDFHNLCVEQESTTNNVELNDQKLPISITEDLIQQSNNNDSNNTYNQLDSMNNLYFCTNNREIKKQVEGLNQTVETLSIIFQDITTLREDIQTTLIRAKDNRIAFQTLSDQLLDIKSMQHQSPITTISGNVSPVFDDDSDDGNSSDATFMSTSSVQKLDCLKDGGISDNIFPTTKSVLSVGGALLGETREDFNEASRSINAIAPSRE